MLLSSHQAQNLGLIIAHSCTMSAPPAPSEAELLEKKAGLSGTETKEGSTVDPDVLALYKKTWADNGGDKDKVCAALSIDAAKWTHDYDEKAFLGKFLGLKE